MTMQTANETTIERPAQVTEYLTVQGKAREGWQDTDGTTRYMTTMIGQWETTEEGLAAARECAEGENRAYGEDMVYKVIRVTSTVTRTTTTAEVL